MTEVKHTDVVRVFFSNNPKAQAHEYFDMLWGLGYCTRAEAYIYLAEWLGVPEKQAHMAVMNDNQAKEVVKFAIQKLNDFRRLDLDLVNVAPHPYYDLITISKKQYKRNLRKERLDKLKEQYHPALIEMMQLIFKAEICPYCKENTEYVDSSCIYGKSYGMIYLCRKCRAWVGVHKGTDKALGRLANDELREWKKKAHAAFDPIWKSNLKNRHQAYAWVSEQLNIPPEFTHIGMFGVDTCKKLVELCKKELA